MSEVLQALSLHQKKQKPWFVHLFILWSLFPHHQSACRGVCESANWQGLFLWKSSHAIVIRESVCQNWGLDNYFSCSPKCPSLPNSLRFLILALGHGKHLGCLRTHWSCIRILDSVVPEEILSQWDLLGDFIVDFIKSHAYLLSLIRDNNWWAPSLFPPLFCFFLHERNIFTVV